MKLQEHANLHAVEHSSIAIWLAVHTLICYGVIAQTGDTDVGTSCIVRYCAKDCGQTAMSKGRSMVLEEAMQREGPLDVR